jgi:DamX protein
MASYWQKYGLTSDPFVDDGLECEPFFPSRWHQQLDLLRHLARSSNMVLLVTGISGVGKTTFMEMLFDQIEPKAGVCKVHGSNGVTPDVLQELIIRHIGMPTTGSPEANFQQRFVQQTERMYQEKDEFYLVIDNAHKLPKSSLALLVDVAEWQTGEAHPLHLILFGGPQLDAMMAEITAQHLGEAMTHTIRIEPFSLEMTKDYILHRLTQAGFDGSYPLTDLQTNQIHQASNGIPAKINIIARQVLLDNEPKNNKRKAVKSSSNNYREKEVRNRPASSSTTSITTWLVIGSAAVIGIILFVVYYFRAPVDTQTTQQLAVQNNVPSVAESSAPVVATTTENSAAIQADMDEDQTQTEGLNGMVASAQQSAPTQTSAPQQTTQTNTDTIQTQDTATVTAATDDSTNNVTATQAQSATTTETATAQSTSHSSQGTNGMWIPLNAKQAKTINQSTIPAPLNKPIVTTVDDTTSTEQQAITSKPATPAKTSVVVSKSSTKPTTKAITPKKVVVTNTLSLTSDEQALMAADTARFTLQIAAAADYQGLKEFIKAAGLDGQVYFFRTLNAGHPWYVAVYGDYANEAAAREAISKLPSSLLAKEHPWPRSFGNIQKAIKVKT